jgi:hypothetical protein
MGGDRVFHVLEQELAGIAAERNPTEWVATALALANAKIEASEQFGVHGSIEEAIGLCGRREAGTGHLEEGVTALFAIR